MKLKICIAVAVSLITVAFAQSEEEDQSKYKITPRPCPNFQLQCPPCADDERCVYPDSGGCIGAGIPTCMPKTCSTLCLTRRIQCPEECPFSCKYDGPPCCPFNGEPQCAPVCQTFVRCAITPCPADCPDDCFYPNANECCPQSGTPICKNKIPAIEENHKRDWKHKGHHNEEPEWFYYPPYPPPPPPPPPMVYGYYGEDDCDEDEDNHWGEGNRGHWGEGHHGGGRNHGHGSNGHHRHEDDYDEEDSELYEGLFIGAPRKQHCPTCTKTVTDVSVKLEFVTTTRDPKDIICPKFVHPCPAACPYNCIYPMDQPCPFNKKPWCPSIYDYQDPPCDTIYETRGYPTPYFPVTDPYYHHFTSMMNCTDETTTTTPIATPTTTTNAETESPVFCPLIFKYCPIECRDNCLRPDVPCPYAADGYCPGGPSKTITSDQPSITPAILPAPNEGEICPAYMFGCPVCPDEYICHRETTGSCPNTNVPICISTIAVDGRATYSFYVDPVQEYETYYNYVSSPGFTSTSYRYDQSSGSYEWSVPGFTTSFSFSFQDQGSTIYFNGTDGGDYSYFYGSEFSFVDLPIETGGGQYSYSQSVGDYTFSQSVGDYTFSQSAGQYSFSQGAGQYSFSQGTGEYSFSQSAGDFTFFFTQSDGQQATIYPSVSQSGGAYTFYFDQPNGEASTLFASSQSNGDLTFYDVSTGSRTTVFVDDVKQQAQLHEQKINEIHRRNMHRRQAQGEDVCAKTGLIRIDTPEIFKQMQENQEGCSGCPTFDWDHNCDNTCAYRTEDDCCIKTMCLPNF